MKRRGGFTLIELLIVITIIGILSTIILNSVSDSRIRAYNSKVKQQLSGFRAAAEIYFLNQTPVSYRPDTSSCSSGMFADSNPSDGNPASYIDLDNLPDFVQLRCQSVTVGIDSYYAIKASLYSGNEYWCVDSRGASKSVPGAIGDPVTQCP